MMTIMLVTHVLLISITISYTNANISSINETIDGDANDGVSNPFVTIFASFNTKEIAQLNSSLVNRTYAQLKQMLDNKLSPIVRADIELFKTAKASPDTVRLFNSKLTTIQREYLKAYQNATAFDYMSAIWLSSNANTIPLIDQIAVISYCQDKNIEEENSRGFFSRIWAKIKSIFQSTKELNCDPEFGPFKSIYQTLFTPADLAFIDTSIESMNLSSLVEYFDDQFQQLSTEMQHNISEWIKVNLAPEILAVLAQNTSDDEESAALDVLRSANRLTSLKHHYRQLIEAQNDTSRDTIYEYCQRANQTFARCYMPIFNNGNGSSQIAEYHPLPTTINIIIPIGNTNITNNDNDA